MNRTVLIVLILALFAYVAKPTLAAPKWLSAEEVANMIEEALAPMTNALNSLSDRVQTLEDASPPVNEQSIIDVQWHAGQSVFSTNSTTDVALGNQVTLNCGVDCTIWAEYYVDTRNNGTCPDPRGCFNIYSLYIDGQPVAVNQASSPVPNMAIPLSLNTVMPVSAGTHTVEVLARVAIGGQLESHSSMLQAMAIKN